ncbi:unnamed protein product [Meloidogyne enterolobii]|uniref:Uncharacterized protein n=1 Tax=Meloidogyne enterolobii TaxID=390850 RepID=A0ACB0ZG86_MELEN
MIRFIVIAPSIIFFFPSSLLAFHPSTSPYYSISSSLSSSISSSTLTFSHLIPSKPFFRS